MPVLRVVRPGLGCCAGVLLLASGCSDAGAAREVVVRFQQAVQEEDFDALFCLSAGAAGSVELGSDAGERRAAFERWARARVEEYRIARDRGHVELAGEPIPLVKLFSLGRGTYFEFGASRSSGGGTLELPLHLRFGYAQLDLSRLSPGTTFYLSGAPAGTVHPVRVPRRSKELTLDVLDGLTVVWTLVRSEGGDGCPDGWAVASAAPVAGSEVATEITWVF